LSSDEQNTPYTDKHGGNKKGSYDVTCARDNFVQSSTPVTISVQSALVPDILRNSVTSTEACAGSMRIPNTSVSSAARVPMHSQSALPDQPLTASELAVQSSAACDGSRHVVESGHLPAFTNKSSYSPASHGGQPVNSEPRQNGQFHYSSLPCGSHFVQASHQRHTPYEVQGSGASCNHKGCYCQSSPQHSVVPASFISPASQHTVHAGVRQPCHLIPTHGSRLPVKAKCKSDNTADQLDDRRCVSHVSPPTAAKVMPLRPSSMVPVSSQHGVLPGSSKAIHCTSQSGAPLVGPGPHCNAPVCHQGLLYDNGQCFSQTSSALINNDQHSECQVDMQHTSARSLTPAVSVAADSYPRTVDDLLQTVQVQNVTRPVASANDFVTVDDFVESVLSHNSPSTDSGLQVNDSGDTPLVTSSPSVAVDNCNNVLHDDDSVARSEDVSSQWSLNVKKCRKVAVESDTCGHLGYFQDKTKATKTMEQFSPGDNHPKVCSVAVNTSFYWPPDDSGSSQNNDITAQAVIDMAVRQNSGYARDADSPGMDVLQRLRDSNRDTELLNDTCDSMADISLHTPPPPVFPSPCEESVVSEVIVDMPEYFALSQEK